MKILKEMKETMKNNDSSLSSLSIIKKKYYCRC